MSKENVLLGIETIENFLLINTSQVPIGFRMNSKNLEIARSTGVASTSKYIIDPISGVVQPFSKKPIKVNSKINFKFLVYVNAVYFLLFEKCNFLLKVNRIHRLTLS